MATNTWTPDSTDSSFREALAIKFKTVDLGAFAACVLMMPGREIEIGNCMNHLRLVMLIFFNHWAILEKLIKQIFSVGFLVNQFFNFFRLEYLLRARRGRRSSRPWFEILISQHYNYKYFRRYQYWRTFSSWSSFITLVFGLCAFTVMMNSFHFNPGLIINLWEQLL